MPENTKSMACRAIWRVDDDDVQLAKRKICSKRLQLDDVVIGIPGVQYFFSAITSLASNTRRANDSVVAREGYPGVSYFIVYKPNSNCNEQTVFGAMHAADMEPTVSRINTRATNDEEIAARQLMQVLKDHCNTMVTEMVRTSNTYCYAQARRSVSDGEGSSSQAVDKPTYFPASPCKLVVVDRNQFVDTLVTVHANLVSDGLVCEFVERPNHTPSSIPTCPSDLTTTLRHIDDLMRICKHALYRGHVYTQPEGAVMTFVKLMDVESYLHRLLTDDALRERVRKHSASLRKIMSHPACAIIAQLNFDNDMIEVNDGWVFKISTRTFVHHPIAQELFRKVSPRTFVPYDCADEPDGGYFRSGILNSFDDRETQLNFLNKFYQCLVASRIPLKVRKLVVAGPKDSGKTSWASILRRIVPTECIASIPNEAHFSAAMISDETQLVMIDNWSASTMDSTLAKTVLQGGWMVASVKHKSPRCLHNNSRFYITTNKVPDFGSENENIGRLLAIFETKSLPETIVDADKWMYENAMACVSWMAQELNEGIDMVEREERWYEHNVLAVTTASTTPNLDKVTLEEITDRLIRSDIDPPIRSTLVIKRKRKRR